MRGCGPHFLVFFGFLITVAFLVTESSAQTTTVKECLDYRDNCTACFSNDDSFDCSFCTTPYAVGCFNSTFATYCSALSGSTSCNATGTNCSSIYTCEGCAAASWCSWCSTQGSGYCFSNTGAFVCTGIGGSFVSTCPSSSQTVSTIPPSSTGPTPTNDYAEVDPSGRCEQFAGSNCQGIVFYNVYANRTYDQKAMAAGAGFLLSFSNIPGITSSCREVATKLTCGQYYQECTSIANGVSVPVPPCRSLCESVNYECSDILRENNLLLDCNQIDPSVGVYNYPETSRVYLYNGERYSVKCNDMTPQDYFPNMLNNPGFESWTSGDSAVGWKSFQLENQLEDYEQDLDVVNGTNSTVLRIVGDSNLRAAYQEISMNRTAILPIRIMGLSRAEDVQVDTPPSYSIRVVLENGANFSEFSANFTQGTHPYMQSSLEFSPKFPVQLATVYVQLEGTGEAYFDNIVFQEKVPDKPPVATCAFPFENFPDSVQNPGDSPCQFRCPNLNVWDNANTYWANFPMVSTISWISWFGTSFVILTFVFFPERRKFPDRLVVYFAASLWIVAFRGVLLSFYRPESYLCKNEWTDADMSVPICAFTSFILQFAAIGVIGWWLSIVISTYLLIVFSIKRRDWSWTEKYMHIVVWLTATLTMVIPGSMGKFGGGLAASMCWLVNDNDSWWQFSMFYIPLGVVITVGTPILAHACWVIYKVTRNSKSDSSKKKMKAAYIKLILFLMIIFCNLVFLFSYKFYTYAVTDKLLALFAEEVVCRAKGGGDECMGPRINASTLLLNNFFFNSAGLFSSIFFISQYRNRRLWMDWLRKHPRFASAMTTLPGSSIKSSQEMEMSQVSRASIEKNTTVSSNSDDVLVYQSKSLNPFAKKASLEMSDPADASNEGETDISLQIDVTASGAHGNHSSNDDEGNVENGNHTNGD